MSQQEVPRLKKGQVSTLGALVEEIAAMAPACDVVVFITSAIAYAFALTPLAFLLATLAMYLEVNTLYHLAKRHASAGGYYGYIANAFGPVPGYHIWITLSLISSNKYCRNSHLHRRCYYSSILRLLLPYSPTILALVTVNSSIRNSSNNISNNRNKTSDYYFEIRFIIRSGIFSSNRSNCNY
ncbi:hypothetical protein KN1_29360 [Stygiolobus caldivivus]|uniref:Amino acid permease/ SLC12A domain-containing protein n=1 Tax=Stygiolobus caldivivus TaxID=2824673 RepID=A0A8D5ZJJ0_9CREN|nr:hypothetical protein KN1_29360 [Stygiolobus caldivivus]